MQLHEEIRRARKELKLSQVELSKMAGVQRRQLSSLENGKNVTLRTVRKVIAVLPNIQRFTLAPAEVQVEPKPLTGFDWDEMAKTMSLMMEMFKKLSELRPALDAAVAAGNLEEAARLQAEMERLPSPELRRRLWNE